MMQLITACRVTLWGGRINSLKMATLALSLLCSLALNNHSMGLERALARPTYAVHGLSDGGDCKAPRDECAHKCHVRRSIFLQPLTDCDCFRCYSRLFTIQSHSTTKSRLGLGFLSWEFHLLFFWIARLAWDPPGVGRELRTSVSVSVLSTPLMQSRSRVAPASF